jgi:hypothetical protein
MDLAGAGKARHMRKKQLKRELRELADSHEDLRRAHRQLATHAEVIAVAVRSPDLVPQSDLDDAIAGIHELNAEIAASTSTSALRSAAPVAEAV